MPITNLGSGQGMDYNVDIVMCIDATASMRPIIREVKDNALSFYRQFIAEMDKADKSVQQLRVKVIVFRDYGVDSVPMVESPFFVLDDESEAFHNFVEGIEAMGGGDEPESALEALALAMKSDWSRAAGSKKRHVIMMYSDASALPLDARASQPGYPADMPKNFAELRDMWDGQLMETSAKRLLIFAPNTEPWSNMVDWSNTFHTPSRAGGGLDTVDIETCIHILVNSI